MVSIRTPGRLQIEDQAGDAAVLGRIRVGAGIQGAPPRQVGLGGPDLVTVDPEYVTVALSAGAQAGEVRSGFRFGHAQRPPFVAAQQGHQQTVDLLGCAELADAGCGDAGAGDVGHLRRGPQRGLDADFHGVTQAQRPAAVLARPGGL